MINRQINNHEWMYSFDQRQRNEIAFNRLYADDFAHGTDGHNLRIIVALMAALLDQQEDEINRLKGNNGTV